MLQKILIGLCLACMASASFSGVLDKTSRNHINTRFGEIRVVETGTNIFDPDIVLFHNYIVYDVSDAIVWIEGSAEYSETMDIVLMGLSSGGTACPAMFALVGVSNIAAQHLGTFGTCSDIIREFRRVGSTLEFDVPSLSPELSHVTAIFDGIRVIEIDVRRVDFGAAPAGPGEDVTRWIGEHPAAPFSEASERLRFKQIMTEEELYELTGTVSIASAAQRDGDYVIGTGNVPHMGGSFEGAWVIRISDGRPFAAIWRDDSSPKIFGGTLSELPSRLRDFVLKER